MSATAFKEIDQDASTSGDQAREEMSFLPLDLYGKELSDEQTAKMDLSADRFKAWDEVLEQHFIGIGLDISQSKVFRRPAVRSHHQVRTNPSTTGNVVEWEGVVETVEEGEFSARLVAVKGSKNDFDEFTDFDLSDVQPGDRYLVEPGAIFRLLMGTQAIGGTREKVWNIVFRRLPAWKKSSVHDAQQRLNAMFDGIEWVDAAQAEGD
ncbi:hypothetical protein MUY21_09765 [Aliiroseovarius sp. S2029]|uniref:hypothetical protein n=1 Tax=Aliiroseovarius sp. S2029 TaxID=2936988 RepID=UPI0020C057BD|nr:hypothetical protein [Aliiroseovarius sp. S2029]MCK8484322.1 hypothetical protein [Aliiroseovarius sp. S2029]